MVVLWMQPNTSSTISFHVYLCKIALTNQLSDLVGSQEVPQNTKLFKAIDPLITDSLIAHVILQRMSASSEP